MTIYAILGNDGGSVALLPTPQSSTPTITFESESDSDYTETCSLRRYRQLISDAGSGR